MREHADIEELLRGAAAAVLPDRPDAEAIGTAFRIAPEYAVTAGHVVRTVGTRVRLRFGGNGSECTAEVIAAFPEPGRNQRWDFDDHAVLRLENPEQVTAPCALMAEPSLSPGDDLIICALNAVFEERVLEIYHNYRVRDVHPRFFTIDGDRQVIQGMSGGPVWSIRHGGIVGFVKGTENAAAVGGAVAFLLDGLRRLCPVELYDDLVTAHDLHHRDDRVWVDRLVGADAIVRRWLVEIHGLLARIPPGEARAVPSGLVDRLFRDSVLPEPSRLVRLRDLGEYVGTESRNRHFDLARFCALAPDHLPFADQSITEALHRMPRTIVSPREYPQFERRFLRERMVRTAPTTLFGLIRTEETPVLDEQGDTAYRFEVHRKFDDQDIIPLEQSTPYSSYEHAKRDLKVALDTELSKTGAPSDSVEIVVALPDEQLAEEPLYEWRRTDQRPFHKYVLRLRRSSTWEKDEEQLIELQERYHRLRKPLADGLFWLGCLDPRSETLAALQELFVHDLDNPHPLDGLAVTQPPTVHVLTAAGTNSLPVTLWRTVHCPEHPEGAVECGGTVFRARLLAQLSEISPIDWYRKIWREQRSTQASPERDEFWRKIIYILDKPGESRRRPPPLAGPQPARGVAV